MNKVERMQTILQGGVPDRTPAGFWFHYNGQLSPREMAENHLELYRKTDMDIVKVMQDYPYPLEGTVRVPSDWYKLKFLGTGSPHYQKLADVLKRILDGVGGNAMVFQTMFGPFKAAAIAFGDELVMAHAKEDPKAVAAGVNAIGEVLGQWAAAYLDEGASGIYYSAQFSEPGRFTKEEWAGLVRPSDEMVLRAAHDRADRYNILHICGEPDYDFHTNVEWFGDYPADLINWSVKDNGYSLEKGREFFGKPILGGMNNKGNILSGSDNEIIAEVNSAISRFGQAGFMLGADCTIQGENISLEKIRTAVQAAHDYK